jgi:hypothetical protein
MTFLAPMMLIGAAAVAIPLALHFFYRARYKPLPWAPMKFLKEAIEQTSRRLKFQEWILLALRCLAIILLAIAIARPGLKTATVAGRGDAIDAVLVFDTSYSMGASGGAKTHLQSAKDAAIGILNGLPANSSVQIYACSDRATFVGPMQRFNLDQARQLIPGIELTSLSSDLLPGLTEALNGAKTGTAPAKEIYVFTDLQKEAFDRQQGAVKAKCEEIKAIANLVFVRCGTPESKVANIALQDVAWISETLPHTKTRVPFKITLKNTGSEIVKGPKVQLEIDGKAVEKDAVQLDQIDGGQTSTVMLTGSLDAPGLRVIGVEVTGDQLPGDNVLYKTILVRDKVRVLLVDGTPNPNNPTEAGDHWVKTALNPPRAVDYYVESESVAASEASPRDLDNKEIVYLLNAPVRGSDPLVGLSPDFVKKLTEFVKNGGGLVIGCGDLVNSDAYNKSLGSAGAGLLPFDLKEVLTTTETSPYHPGADTVDKASFLEKFASGSYAEALQAIAIYRMFGLVDAGPGARVLVKADGKPYITSKVVGAGEVILVTGSLDDRWGSFSSDPGSFHVPFANFILRNLTSRKVSGGTSIAGNPIVWLAPPDAGDAFELVMPPKAGEKVRPRMKLDVSEPNNEGKRTVTATETSRAGIYHIVPQGKGDESGPVFAVNPDLRESDKMAIARDEDIENLLGFRPSIVQAGAGTAGSVEQLRTRSEWTEWVLVMLLVLLVVEAIWAWTCGRAW